MATIKEESSIERKPQEKGPDPGQYENVYKPMGADLGKVDFGSKYKFKPKDGPAPG